MSLFSRNIQFSHIELVPESKDPAYVKQSYVWDLPLLYEIAIDVDGVWLTQVIRNKRDDFF
jgi:hypothetical protein